MLKEQLFYFILYYLATKEKVYDQLRVIIKAF